ncbi:MULTISPECIES: heparinase II/III domain-containing protein [unclassified Sphingopyxis]|uniref:heparinase II/III domain-containing protein n=1 Tax=unclassified Sphingopyxis TaxID=2614943 RepID=UPI0007372F0D|nr:MULTISPECIES: heparinase II/III family protein [unclassified Sphingopyxis]KTE40065.1 alginate lyase [Sphingopyxis sp. HIX]KTE86007.1 alginate lyase [Sphingopyxis sp. HXXIV]
MTRTLALLLAAATLHAIPAQAQTPPAAVPQAYAPLFAGEVERARRDVDASIAAGINVPVPKDPGGGFTHEQHKRNYRVIFEGGQLFRLTGEARYRDHVRAMLLAYADLYPGLGPHPAKANQSAGRLFWQSLNDSVFLVNAVQGYAEIRASLSAADRQRIDDRVIRPMAHFLSDGSPEVIDRIHNHATWAAAGVGLSGYLLGDRDLVDKALLGLDKSGKAGFLRQLDLLFSPDGYYAEGPYYQRYALQPFVVFAAAIAANDPDRRIFEYRGGIVLKAIRTAIDVTHDGYFLPINDAMPDKSLRTEELYHAVAIAYGATKDPAFLSIADWQGRTVLTPAGQAMAADLAAGKAQPWPFGSRLLSDGPDGKQGALVLLRTKPDPSGPLLVAKNTVQGMGHGHFDRLGWLYYDETGAVVTDYGAARFLNVEAKQGGRYLPENDSWASATIAHNTLVVDEQSHFGGDWKAGEKVGTRQLAASLDGPTRYAIGAIDGAYKDVAFRRALLLVEVDGLANPLVLDILHPTGSGRHRYDLPLHFSGHIIDSDIAFARKLAERPVLGQANGYQHLWVDGEGSKAGKARLTWMQGSRFYSYHMLPPAGARFIVAESGANDPDFNLRREPVVIQRVDGAGDATFVSLLEPHGAYDASAETVVASSARVTGLEHRREGDIDIILVTLVDGRRIAIAVADDVTATAKHSVGIDGQTLAWTGPVGRLDLAKTGAKK